MRVLKAHVREGRIVIDEPTELPEGTEFELVPLDDGMTPEERAELEAMVEESEAEFARGESVSLEQLWDTLRSIR
jgi:hypothetical protein